MPLSSFDDTDNERRRWNQKYLEYSSSDLKNGPDPLLEWAFNEHVRPEFPEPGSALDLAGGTGRHAIWLAKKGWKVTVIDISEAGIEIARREAGALAPSIKFVVDDLTRLKASQFSNGHGQFKGRHRGAAANFNLVMVFNYLERSIFPEIIRAVRPGGFLIYKTYKTSKSEFVNGPRDPRHLLRDGELRQLAQGFEALHYREIETDGRSTAELVARKYVSQQPCRSSLD